MFDMLSIIEKKKQGKPLSEEEIRGFIRRYTDGELPDYQAAALLMAIVLKGMDNAETACLTLAMAESGSMADLSGIGDFVADKHSTGGVGDKTTLVVLPMAAACGVKIAKLSGRGLGHTGGTIDKLSSIPGLRTDLDEQAFLRVVRDVGFAIAAQTKDLVPADRLLYALRDVTGTVDSIPLIASSIMSKKIASGADGIVLDVKTGSGAFMKHPDGARELARLMVDIGSRTGKKVIALLTRMDRPLGYAVGNSLEVREAVATLKGNGPADLTELSVELAAALLVVSGMADWEEGRRLAVDALKQGSALKKLISMVTAQGGDPSYILEPGRFAEARYKSVLPAWDDGFIANMKTDAIGRAAVQLGAGRALKDDVIDLSCGMIFTRRTGEKVRKGEPIVTLYGEDRNRLAQAVQRLKDAVTLSVDPPPSVSLIRDRLTNIS